MSLVWSELPAHFRNVDKAVTQLTVTTFRNRSIRSRDRMPPARDTVCHALATI